MGLSWVDKVIKGIVKSMIGAVWMAAILALSLPVHADEGARHGAYPSVGGPMEAERTGGADVAVVIGVGEYPWLPDVAGVGETVRDWEDFFEHGLGVPEVHTLLGSQATRERMARFIEQAAETVGQEGTLWFVFVGHGAPDPEQGDGLLVGVDAQPQLESLVSRSLRRSDVVAMLERGGQSRTVMVLDACFTGTTSGGESLIPGAQPVLPVRSRPSVAQETVILSAAGAGEVAGPLPGEQRPAFSYFLLGAMRGWAIEDGESVSAAQALAYTQAKLRRIRERHQTPELFGAGDLILVRGVREADPLVNWRGMAPLAASSSSADLYVQSPSDLLRRETLEERESPQETSIENEEGESEQVEGRLQEEALEEADPDALAAYRARSLFEREGVFYQGSWTNPLGNREFYEVLQRSDLAEQYRPTRWWGVLGSTAAVAGLGVGYAYYQGHRSFDHNEGDWSWTQAAGTMTSFAFLGATAGWYLGQVIFGERHPLNHSERRGAVEEFNQRLARELGIPGHLTVSPQIGESVGLNLRVEY